MLRVVARLLLTGAFKYRPTRTLGFEPASRGFHLGLAKGVIPAQRSLLLALGTRYSSSASDKDQTPLVDSSSGPEVSAGTPRSGHNSDDQSKKKKKAKSETNPKVSAGTPRSGHNSDDQSKKKKKAKSETNPKKNKDGGVKGNENKASKFKNKKKHKEGNERIIAALADAINEDDWPGIIRHSTLNPQLLDGWYPGESDWQAAHRMSEALVGIRGDIYENGAISARKLAKVIARKHMGQVTYLPEVEDEDEMELYRNWGPAIGYDFEEVWAAEAERSERLNKKRSEAGKSGKPGKPDGSRPGSA
ncbi:hypothetical protein RSAG8_02264, partial [Rhizoctonia solani AG-8 WAC10335]